MISSIVLFFLVSIWAAWYRHRVYTRIAEEGGYEPVATDPSSVPVATAEPI